MIHNPLLDKTNQMVIHCYLIDLQGIALHMRELCTFFYKGHYIAEQLVIFACAVARVVVDIAMCYAEMAFKH